MRSRYLTKDEYKYIKEKFGSVVVKTLVEEYGEFEIIGRLADIDEVMEGKDYSLYAVETYNGKEVSMNLWIVKIIGTEKLSFIGEDMLIGRN